MHWILPANVAEGKDGTDEVCEEPGLTRGRADAGPGLTRGRADAGWADAGERGRMGVGERGRMGVGDAGAGFGAGVSR